MIRIREIQVTENKNETKSLEMVKQSTVQQSNKLGVLHVVPMMVPISKLGIMKNTKPVTKPTTVTPSYTGKADVYQQRKIMLAECRELFTALMRLPDKELQNKILKVINEHGTVEYRSMQTQTQPVEIRELTAQEIRQQTYITQKNVPGPSYTSNTTIKKESATSDNGVTNKKRKRKRKVSLPQANKESRFARQTAKMNIPTAMIGKKNSSHLRSNENPTKRPRVDSFAFSEGSSDVLWNNMEDMELISDPVDSKKHMLANLVKDILLADIELVETGLLPIHETIIKNQFNSLNRQIYIWKDYKKVDLNELVTDEGEDLLQLAILNTCDPSIINLLLEKDLNPNCLDSESNTVLHLAILNDNNVLSLEHLVKRIDLKLLITLNDDGYTPLHLAVRQDRYLLAERLINIIDERLVGRVHYEREIDGFETDENILKKQFKDFYEKVCSLMDVDEENGCLINNHELKEKLLQSGDRRSGNTSLFFAIENKSEHLIYFLLAHLTDPRTENLSGQDCKTYFCEFGKSLNLSLNIDNAMEKIIKLLS